MTFWRMIGILLALLCHPLAARAAGPSVLFVNADWRGLPHEDLLEVKYVADLKLRDFAVDVANLV